MRALRTGAFVVVAVEVTLVTLMVRSSNLSWPPMRIAGLCLLLLVIAWVAVARYQLGNSFSVKPKARQLITHGLYSRFRNPIYLASPVLVIGLSLVTMQWSPMLLLLVIVPVQMIRARREAAVLREAFGDEYERYRAQTWF